MGKCEKPLSYKVGKHLKDHGGISLLRFLTFLKA